MFGYPTAGGGVVRSNPMAPVEPQINGYVRRWGTGSSPPRLGRFMLIVFYAFLCESIRSEEP